MSIQQKTLDDAISEEKEQFQDAITKLKENQIKVADFNKVSFTTNSFNIESITNEIDKLVVKDSVVDGETDFIYLFKVCGESVNLSELKNAMSTFKSTKSKIKLCKINDNPGTQYLYVGRSQNLTTRIKQHLTSDKYKSVYAMHMDAWCSEVENNVEIMFMKLDKESCIIQLIEDALHSKLKPCFGRKGAL